MIKIVEHTEEYKEGYLAFERGWDIHQCQYFKGSTSHQRWVKGYYDAEYDSEDDSEPL